MDSDFDSQVGKGNGEFDWGLYPKAESLLIGKVDDFLAHSTFAKALSERMMNQASTKFSDMIDYMVVPEQSVDLDGLSGLGFSEIKSEISEGGVRVLKHPSSYFFPLIVSPSKKYEIGLHPEFIDHFLQVLGLGVDVEGEPYAPLRKAIVDVEGDYSVVALERRGYNGFVVKESGDRERYLEALSSFFSRKRHFESDEEGMKSVENLVAKSTGRLSDARVSDAFFITERLYWERRNRAGQVQRARQDTVGIGWGNQDHHTYRSSREHFANMIRIFEKMGYRCREKYYAGEEAGWGAQILEHPVCNTVVFTDVDLLPEETDVDFPHKGLSHVSKLKTVGLWIGLHGESILQAGMHHLEAKFDFNKLREELPNYGIKVMQPFSYFPFLKQAFTVGERWHVEKDRLDRLLADSSITKEQYETFLKEGAIGSHMENLERTEGFKGFNKASVTKIIMATDPRAQQAGA